MQGSAAGVLQEDNGQRKEDRAIILESRAENLPGKSPRFKASSGKYMESSLL